MTTPFWEKRLEALTDGEWEALCDGCGRCCMQKFEDEDTGEMLYTSIACRLFDDAACRCRDYADRLSRVPDCLNVRTLSAGQMQWLPATCAYRLRAEGKPLPRWHPLRTGDPDSVHAAGISMRGRTRSEAEVPEARWPEYILVEELPGA
ncbi:MAG TPA: YcgN family cysteine cluster protein [Mariprofundaceae bacterium]|nr:YcgN family cysteine cluster protein [Mariprofundaceae bacterium]